MNSIDLKQEVVYDPSTYNGKKIQFFERHTHLKKSLILLRHPKVKSYFTL
jgi:hypothetical protein